MSDTPPQLRVGRRGSWRKPADDRQVTRPHPGPDDGALRPPRRGPGQGRGRAGDVQYRVHPRRRARSRHRCCGDLTGLSCQRRPGAHKVRKPPGALSEKPVKDLAGFRFSTDRGQSGAWSHCGPMRERKSARVREGVRVLRAAFGRWAVNYPGSGHKEKPCGVNGNTVHLWHDRSLCPSPGIAPPA